jgi:hypothetical protein
MIESEDPREFGLTAADLNLAADPMYPPDDGRLERLEWTPGDEERMG